ncbi:hypothetical protein J3F83DRAFT_753071 [Trichoderma novae-zelandiae]
MINAFEQLMTTIGDLPPFCWSLVMCGVFFGRRSVDSCLVLVIAASIDAVCGLSHVFGLLHYFSPNLGMSPADCSTSCSHTMLALEFNCLKQPVLITATCTTL